MACPGDSGNIGCGNSGKGGIGDGGKANTTDVVTDGTDGGNGNGGGNCCFSFLILSFNVVI